VLSTWALWVVDPISRLGEHFFLGRLFAYDGPGFWFGLPLGSQLGFAGTSAVLVGMLTWLGRDEPDEPVASAMAHPRMIAVGGFLGQVVFMAGTAFVVARTNSDPRVVATADTLAGAAVIIFLPLVLVVALQWRQLTAAPAAVAAAQPAPRVDLRPASEPAGTIPT